MCERESEKLLVFGTMKDQFCLILKFLTILKVMWVWRKDLV